jgi:hypothetical protein
MATANGVSLGGQAATPGIMEHAQNFTKSNESQPQQSQDGPATNKETVTPLSKSAPDDSSHETQHNAKTEQQTPNDTTPSAPADTSKDSASTNGDDHGGKPLNETKLRSAGEEVADLYDSIKDAGLLRQISDLGSMGDRFELLQEKLERLAVLFRKQNRTGSEDSEPDIDDSDYIEYRHPATKKAVIPALNFLPWKEFIEGLHPPEKSKEAKEKQQSKYFAIDVLSEEPVVWWQKDQTDSSGNIQRRDVSAEQNSGIGGTESLKPMPDRIRINSRGLLSLIGEIGDMTDLAKPLVLRKPYKMLHHCEEKFRETYRTLKEKWGQSTRTGGDSTKDTHATKASEPTLAPEQDGPARSTLSRSETIYKFPAETSIDPRLRDSAEALRDLECLIQFMDDFLTPRTERYQKLNHPKIRFDDLWYLFAPGDDIILAQNTAKALRVLTTFGGRQKLSTSESLDDDTFKPSAKELKISPFTIHCCYLDFDGKELGPVYRNYKIEHFDGEKDITTLKVFPLRYHRDSAKIRQQLLERGRHFRDCIRTPQLRFFKGRTLNRDWDEEYLKEFDDEVVRSEEVEAQVIIDMDRAFRNNYRWVPTFGDLDSERFDPDDRETNQRLNNHCKGVDYCMENIEMDRFYDLRRMVELFENQPTLDYPAQTNFNDLSDDDLIITSGYVFGFVLRSRKWGKFPLILCVLQKGSNFLV